MAKALDHVEVEEAFVLDAGEEVAVNLQTTPFTGPVIEANPVLRMLAHGEPVSSARRNSMAVRAFLSPRGPTLFANLIRASRARTWAVMAFLEVASRERRPDDLIDAALSEPDQKLLERVIEKVDAGQEVHFQLRNCLNQINDRVTAKTVAVVNLLLQLGHDPHSARRVVGDNLWTGGRLLEVLKYARQMCRSDTARLAAHLCESTYSLAALDELCCRLVPSGCLPSGKQLSAMNDMTDFNQFLWKKLNCGRSITLPTPEITHAHVKWMRTGSEVRALGRDMSVCLEWDAGYIWRGLLGQHIGAFDGLGADNLVVFTARVDRAVEILEAKRRDNVRLEAGELRQMLHILNVAAPQAIAWELSQEFLCEAVGFSIMMR